MEEQKYYRLYGKGPGMKTFKAMDLSSGAPVNNLIYATFWTSEEVVKGILARVTSMNEDWKFEIRSTN